MAQRIVYRAEDKLGRDGEPLFDASWAGRGKGSGATRAVKMARPECKECQIGGDELVGWWDSNPEHDHYWSLQAKVIKNPKYTVDDDGDLVLDEEETKRLSRTKFIRLPNIVEVVKQGGSNSGIGPDKFARRKGFKLLPEIGVAPMCEMYGCGRSWPTVRTEIGDYCSEGHAKLAMANENGVKFTIYVDPNVPEAKNLQRQELANIVI